MNLRRRIGTKEAWNSFLSARGSGPYANLAHTALDKLEAAENASEKADAINARRKSKPNKKRKI